MEVEIIGREKTRARLVTRDGEDEDLRMKDQDVTPEPAGLEVWQHTILEGTDRPRYSVYFNITANARMLSA